MLARRRHIVAVALVVALIVMLLVAAPASPGDGGSTYSSSANSLSPAHLTPGSSYTARRVTPVGGVAATDPSGNVREALLPRCSEGDSSFTGSASEDRQSRATQEDVTQ